MRIGKNYGTPPSRLLMEKEHQAKGGEWKKNSYDVVKCFPALSMDLMKLDEFKSAAFWE